jgi:hypothetical protein
MENDLSGWNGRCKPDKSQKSFPQQESRPMNGLTTASWRTEEQPKNRNENHTPELKPGIILEKNGMEIISIVRVIWNISFS